MIKVSKPCLIALRNKHYQINTLWKDMMMMIHSISSAPFICENHIQRRLTPQIVIITFTFAGKGVF